MLRKNGICTSGIAYFTDRGSLLNQQSLLAYLLLAFLCIPACATVNVKNYGALGDGTRNDTAPLNTAFTTACAESEDVFIPEGTYVVSSLDPLNNCAISIYGEGATNTILKLTAASHQSMWTFRGSAARTLALVIRDLALDGGNLGSSGIVIEQYEAVTINGVSVHDFGRPGYSRGHKKPLDGVYIRNVENVQVTQCQFTGNERYGIELQAVHISTVRNSAISFNGGMGGVSEQNFEGPLDGPLVAQWLDNTFIANGGGGIDVETDPKLPPAQGILLANHVIDCGNDRWDAGWGLVLGLRSFGSIEGNWVQNFAADAPAGDYTNAIVYTRNAGPIAITNNKVFGTKSRAILGINGTSPVAITGNTLIGNGTGILVYNSPRVRIANNTVTNSSGFGIAVLWSHRSTVTGNQLAGNLRDLGINPHNTEPGPGDGATRSSAIE